MNIVIVDDDQLVALSLQTILEADDNIQDPDKFCFRIYPFAPRLRALIMYSSSEKVVSRRILASGCAAIMVSDASSPFISSILMSMRRTSGEYLL